ncbi:hypothetical protein BMI86_02405 [Thioclava sp. DLFJ5-1]|uniref:energy transducer TonB family protein n=1 Tax=Thioclava sp. DLFJ5-1 TaxID=1915314 RepID=UPI0009979144|nr:energy transducer TonB [Thioclava sp. DLFJ5-1]OOY21444.1 hypothetical protein BMI86_02405 [Thioclava sp. DLFJ5-1]
MTLRGLAFVGALGAALAVHAGVLMVWEPASAGGAQSAGDGGEALVSLAPSSPSMAARVAEWERPPEVETEVAATQPEAPTAPEAPETPAAPSDPAPRTATAPTLTAPPAPDAALPEQAEPAPPDMPRPEAKPTPPVPKPAKPKPKAPAKKQASQPAPAQPKQQAKGQGDKGAAGDRRAAPAATLSAGQINALIDSWGGQIRARVARHQRMPAGARRGVVGVIVTVARDGRLLGVSVAQSSGHADLDRAALDAVRRASRFPAAPQGLGKPSYSYSLPMAFR